MRHPFEGGNAIFQSNMSLLRRLMNAISLAQINSDLYFHKMHKLDKNPESCAPYTGKGNIRQKHNYMLVEVMSAKWRQCDKLNQISLMEMNVSVNFSLFCDGVPCTESRTLINIKSQCYVFCVHKGSW